MTALVNALVDAQAGAIWVGHRFEGLGLALGILCMTTALLDA